MIAGSVAVVILAVLMSGWAILVAQDRLLRRRVKDRVVVTLKTGAAFNGLLHEIDGRTLVLRNAKALTSPDARAVIVDGELIVARADVDYLQRPGGGEPSS